MLISYASLLPLGRAQTLLPEMTQHLPSCHLSSGTGTMHFCACIHTSCTRTAIHTNTSSRTQPQRHSCDLNSGVFAGVPTLNFCEPDKVLTLPLFVEHLGLCSLTRSLCKCWSSRGFILPRDRFGPCPASGQ